MSYKLFVTCTPGLEEILEREITALGYSTHRGSGGVEVEVTFLRDAMTLNLFLRTAIRVLWHLFDIEYPTKHRFYRELSERDWRPFFKGLPSIAIDVPFSTHPDFVHSLYASQLAKDAICDQLRKATGARPLVDTKNPEVQFSIVLDTEKACVYFDTSGQPLFKRGYRSEAVVAPLKETLAAALLMLAGYTPESILVDPCCGGGTFLIEAGLMATHAAPGLQRTSFGFFRHPDFQDEEWRVLRKQALSMITSFSSRKLFGFEKDARSYRLLLRSIAKAGLMSMIEVVHADFRDHVVPEQPNFVITNLPFGVRLGEASRWIGLYRSVGLLMKKSTAKPAVGGVLTASSALAREIGLKPRKKIRISHGGLDCIFYIYDLYPS